MTEAKFTKERIDAMSAIAEGADVRSRAIARELRSLQAEHPTWLEIGGRRMGPYGVREKLPYFGAILTAEGSTALAAARGES